MKSKGSIRSILFLFLLLTAFALKAQDHNISYVLLNDKSKSLYHLAVSDDLSYAQLKIKYWERKDEGFSPKVRPTEPDSMVKVSTEPYELPFYTFESFQSPELVTDLNKITIVPIERVSKHLLWNTTPPYMLKFIEKVADKEYRIWSMIPEMRE